ncbi:lipocalin-like domain-containing protein [Phenylobacterium soli]|uniref:AttH domain-containing protein n=1 Tax=Phenylobacterium soli TaxID=2170551 RepID=A0A328AIC3_9CAUL|nr:lipocalin-like domain-containing protein [Phenylobacterium soli]RAK53144.1 hypothetical protein DJ017_00650 [Phenylobacterium soli]
MVGTMTAREALLASLDELPMNLRPPGDVEAAVRAAAERLTSPRALEVILTLLGAATSFWSKPPQTPLRFPRDHAFHPGCGPEWYWLTANMDVAGTAGAETIAFVMSMERQQPISPDVLARSGWTEAESQFLFSYACVIHTTPEGSRVYARQPNLVWPPMGGITEMGGDPFVIRCGPDILAGSVNVMPLSVLIADTARADPLIIDVTCTTDMPVESAFFLQGEDGVTPEPRPGTYYSWPQLAVSGSVTIGGQTHQVSGKGWLDHEMMYGEVPPLHPLVPPPARWSAPPGILGWTFGDFNFANGDAMVVAGFQVGPLLTELPAIYGFYLTVEDGRWKKTAVEGVIGLGALMPLTAQCMMPVSWSCALVADGPPFELTVEAKPWYVDGSFMSANLSVQGETPVGLTLSWLGASEIIPGVGYCESVGYEPPATYMARALAFLAASP